MTKNEINEMVIKNSNSNFTVKFNGESYQIEIASVEDNDIESVINTVKRDIEVIAYAELEKWCNGNYFIEQTIDDNGKIVAQKFVGIDEIMEKLKAENSDNEMFNLFMNC